MTKTEPVIEVFAGIDVSAREIKLPVFKVKKRTPLSLALPIMLLDTRRFSPFCWREPSVYVSA
jgi:hypothetical protein